VSCGMINRVAQHVKNNRHAFEVGL